jgi:hypothetical protein
MEMIMLRKSSYLIIVLVLSILALSACNLPERQVSQLKTPTITTPVLPAPSPTPISLCANPYFPSQLGNSWQYSGSNSALGTYNRTDSVSQSGADSFTVNSTLAGVSYDVNYGCSAAGITASDPVQQYAGALLSGPNAPLSVNLSAVSGITLPAKINPGDTWQQTANFSASSPQLNASGTIVIDYTAVGYENVTVPSGTYKALRVDATIRILVTPLKIEAGSYTASTWLVQDIGLVKSEGASHITGIEFSDSLQLNSFTPAP